MQNEEKTKTTDEIDGKKTKNLYNALVRDQKSVFYATDEITNNLINIARTSTYAKDRVLVTIFEKVNSKKIFVSEKAPLNTPFVENKEDVDHSKLYSFKDPFEALQADIADIRYLGKSAVDPKYCLLFVDLLTSVIYTYPIRN